MMDYDVCPHCCEEYLESYYDEQLDSFMLCCHSCGYYCDIYDELEEIEC